MIETTTDSRQKIDAADELRNKATQLHAILSMIYGEGFNTFSVMSGEIQQNYLWACADLAKDVETLSNKI